MSQNLFIKVSLLLKKKKKDVEIWGGVLSYTGRSADGTISWNALFSVYTSFYSVFT